MFGLLDLSLAGVVDLDGRPLLELADPLLGASTPIELVTCTYRGSRHEHARPMNLSALKQVRTHWRAARAGLAYLRALSSPRPAAALSYPGLWRAAVYVDALPRYLRLRARAEGRALRVPTHVGAMYKIALGLSSAVLSAIQARLSAQALSEPVDPDELCAFIEAQGLLIGHRQVCAGSEEMIRDVVRLLCAPAAELDEADCHATAQLIDEQPFASFASQLVNMSVLSTLSLFVTDSIYEALRGSMSEQLGRDDVFARASERSSGLASLSWASMGSFVDLLATGLVDLRAAPPELRARLLDLKRLFGPLSAQQQRELSALLRGAGAFEPEPLLAGVGIYLRWEQALEACGRMLRRAMLESIGEGEGEGSWAAQPLFAPPTLRVRSLLSAVYGMRFRPGGVVQRGSQKLRLDAWVG